VEFYSSQIRADEIDKIRSNLDELYKTSAGLPSLYLKTDKLYKDRYAAARFVDGENLYRIKDYERAAIIFLDIIENYTSYVAYPDALFLYADALFLSGDVLASKHAFERFIKESNRQGAARFKERAVERLLEIAIHTNSFGGMDRYLTMLKQYSTDASRYSEGKFFYFKKDFKQAEESLLNVHTDSQLKLKAQYIIGAILTIQGRNKDALSVFKQALSIKAVTSEDLDVVDLLNLGAGRLNYELGQFDDALKHYRRVRENSPYFDSALYESASATFQAGDATRAEQTLEVLMISIPDSEYLPRAEMLRGNLLLRNSQFDEAENLFNKTVKDFAPMISRLDSVMKQQEDPRLYFWEMVRTGMSSLDMAGVLPPLVVKWVEDEPDVKRALKLNSEFDEAEKDLRETIRLLHLIEAVVKGPTASDVVPLLREGKDRSAMLSNRLAQARFALSSIGEESARGDFPELSSLRSQRILLSEKIRKLPSSEEDLDSREDESTEIFIRMNAELQRNAIRLDQSDATITAIEKFIGDARYKEGIPKESIDAVKLELNRSRTLDDELRKELTELRDAVEEAKYQVGQGDATFQMDLETRVAVKTLSDDEREIFKKMKGRSLNEIEGLFQKIDEIEAIISNFENRMRNEALSSIKQIQAQIASELANLNNCNDQVVRLSSEMKEVVGGVTFENLASVRKRFQTLVIKADVGILDSAWLRKEASTSKITKLNDERLKEVKGLEIDFQEMTSHRDNDSK
jgi:tetratricopeptide (TPR) repeat protein